MDIAVVSNQVRHYSGGRYLGYMAAVALAEHGHHVTVYADRPIPFADDFRPYRQPDVRIVRFQSLLRGSQRHQVYLGVPPFGSEVACVLARRFRAKVAVYLFDVLPLMLRSGRHDDGTRSAYWDSFVRAVHQSTARVIVLARCNQQPAADWLGVDVSRVDVVYPAVNLKRIPNGDATREDSVVWISRILPHKLLPHALEAVSAFAVKLHVICGRAQADHVARYGLRDVVQFHVRISDVEKFSLLRSARVLLSSSCYEGFGMPIAEAWACATPVVAYQLPALFEVVGPMSEITYFASPRDRWQLQEKLLEALTDNRADTVGPDRRFSVAVLGRELTEALTKL